MSSSSTTLLRGTFVAVEGIDGAGTTTQARLLAAWLRTQGRVAHLTCEPSQGPVGKLLRDVLSHRADLLDPTTLALLFAADRVDHVKREIQPKLSHGAWVVSDRYVYSSLAYQSMDHDLQWVEEINRFAPQPDLILYLRTDPELARIRREARSSQADLFESSDLQERISSNYDNIFGSSAMDGSWILDPEGSDWIHQDPPEARPASQRGETWAVLDGGLPAALIHTQLCSLVEKVARLREA